MDTTKIPSKLELIAIHEAGHAVMCCLSNFKKVTRMEISTDGGRTVFDIIETLPSKKEMALWDIKITSGGTVADGILSGIWEQEYCSPLNHLQDGSDKDDDQIKNILRQTSITDAELEAALADVMNQLQKYWIAVQCIAFELLKNNHLDGDQVRDFFNKYQNEK